METLNGDLPISDLFGTGEAEKYLEVMANQDDSVITYDGGIIVSSKFSFSLSYQRLTDRSYLCHSISNGYLSIWVIVGGG
jgi:hypothetical protein